MNSRINECSNQRHPTRPASAAGPSNLDGRRWTHPQAARAGVRRLPAVAVMFFALGLAACGGGGSPTANPAGPGVGGPPPPPPPPPPPTDAGKARITVTVRDAFGVPVARTQVLHRSRLDAFVFGDSVSAETDAAGVAILDVPAGAGRVGAANVGLGHARSDVDLPRNSHTRIDLALEPFKLAAMSAVDAEVVAGSVSPDGRSLEMSVSVAVPAEFYYDVFNAAWSLSSRGNSPLDLPLELKFVSAVDCEARSGEALADLGPGCVDAGDGTDRAWRQAGTASIGPRQAVSADPAGPVLLLLDRSQRAGERDTYDEHLFAAKSLVSALVDDRPVAVGAFAADGGPSGTASPLPEKPVTFYPLDSPGWLPGRAEGFEALESLRGRMGGASALREAVRAGVDFLAARSGPGDRPALVVLTAGAQDVCTTASQCAETAREIADLARQAGVQLWLVGPGDTWSGGESPSPLVVLSRAPGVRHAVAPVQGALHSASELVRGSLQGSSFHQETRFRIESDVAGTIAPGVTVLGDLGIGDFVNSEWGVWQRLPFRATVPAQ